MCVKSIETELVITNFATFVRLPCYLTDSAQPVLSATACSCSCHQRM